VNLAFVIVTFREPRQIERLVSRLASPESYLLIHIDKKTNLRVHDEIVSRLARHERISYIPRTRCDWGHFGIIQAFLNGIKMAIDSGVDFEYLIFMSEQDYPIKPKDEIITTLSRDPSMSYLHNYSLPDDQLYLGGKDRYERYHPAFIARVIRKRSIERKIESTISNILKIKRVFPIGMTPYAGSGYCSLTRECVCYIDDFVNENPGFVRFFKHVWAPDEMFFHTIIMNSRLKDKVVNDNLINVVWDRPGPQPAMMTKEDYDLLIESSALFARKFDVRTNQEIMDMLDEYCDEHGTG